MRPAELYQPKQMNPLTLPS